jgi:hypothetical protein
MPGPSKVFEGVHCTLRVDRPGPGVATVTISGSDVGEFADAPFQELAADVAAGDLQLFVDAREARGATVDVSNDWAQWMRTHRASFRQIHMLTASRFVEVTADFVRRFAELGGLMRIYTDPAEFEEARRMALGPGGPPAAV